MKKTKICKYCREEIDKKASVCPYCQKKQGTGCGTVLAAIVIVVIGALVLSRCSDIREGYEDAEKNAAVQSEADKYSEEDYKAACKSITYEDIARDKDALKGEKVTFTGEVIQSLDGMYRINITKGEYGFYSDTVIFELDTDILSENILEDDIVTVWGESKGFYTYEAIMGQEVTVPRIRAVYIKNDGKQEQ